MIPHALFERIASIILLFTISISGGVMRGKRYLNVRKQGYVTSIHVHMDGPASLKMTWMPTWTQRNLHTDFLIAGLYIVRVDMVQVGWLDI